MHRSTHFPALTERVHGQRILQPDLYGAVDFTAQPHRLATAATDHTALPPKIETARRSSPTTASSS